MLTLMRSAGQKASFEAAAPSIGSDGGSRESMEVFVHPGEFPVDVQQFFASSETTSIELGATWYHNLVDAVYQNHPGVRFYVLRRGGLPIAALPVLVEQASLAKHLHSLANYYSALYAPVIAAEAGADELARLIRFIRFKNAPLASFKFAPMDPDATSYCRLHDALKLAGLAPFSFFCFGNWFLPVESSWPAYLASRDGVLRSTIKRMAKKFVNAGGVLELIQGGDQLERGLVAYERVYAASWKVAEPFQKFMPGLMRACAGRGWLRLGVAWLGSEPIAAQLWIVANGKASIYKLAYDENQKAYAPGTLLTAMLMQHVIEKDGIAEIDYLIGDDPYKKSWMTKRRERWGLVAYNPWALAGLYGLGREVMGRTLKLLMSTVKK